MTSAHLVEAIAILTLSVALVAAVLDNRSARIERRHLAEEAERMKERVRRMATLAAVVGLTLTGNEDADRVEITDRLTVKTRQLCIICPQCWRVSFNPNDVRERYCGACCEYHDQAGR